MLLFRFIYMACNITEVQIVQGGHGTGKTGNLVINFSRQGTRGICTRGRGELRARSHTAIAKAKTISQVIAKLWVM